jgi:hypothetical protein
MKNAKGAKVDAPKDTRRFRCHIRKMASTVKQITLTPPTAPPIIGPRGKDVLLGANAGVVGGGVIMVTVCEVPLVDVPFKFDAVGRVVNELGNSAEADEVVVAGIEGGNA